MRIAIAILAAVLAAPAVFAAVHEQAINAKGTIVDAMCGPDMKTQADADKHERSCALMDHCREAGYGIVIDGKFHKFDAEGSKQAEALLRASEKADHITATVEGTLEHDGSIKVAKLTAE